MSTTTATKSDFTSLPGDTADDGTVFDGDIAWAHYSADPAKWDALVTEDCPTVAAVMVSTDGPWWVEA